MLRDRIAADCGDLEGNAGSLIRIKRCSDGKKLSVSRFDDEEIQEMTSSKDVESRTLDVLVLSEPTRDLRKHVPKFLLPCPRTKEEQMYGQKLLTTNERYFDILFTLLESENTSVIDMAWKLLMKLPMNPKLKSRIASLHEKEEVNWKQLLDPNAMLKLLYVVWCSRAGISFHCITLLYCSLIPIEMHAQTHTRTHTRILTGTVFKSWRKC